MANYVLGVNVTAGTYTVAANTSMKNYVDGKDIAYNNTVPTTAGIQATANNTQQFNTTRVDAIKYCVNSACTTNITSVGIYINNILVNGTMVQFPNGAYMNSTAFCLNATRCMVMNGSALIFRNAG
jgi:hypothetical protein